MHRVAACDRRPGGPDCAGDADAVAGGLPGSTTTRVPTFTR